MKPHTKTKAQLLSDLTDLQARVRELEGMAVRADSAEKKLLQAELDHRRAEVSALMESFGAIIQYRSFKEAARSIFLGCKKMVGATAGYVALLTPDGKTNEVLFLDSGDLRCTVDPGLPMPVRGLRAEAYGAVKAICDNDFAASAWVNFLPHGHMQLDNVLFTPLNIDGKAVGLLGLANKAGGFNQDDLRMASGFGEIAAVALKNSRTVEALKESEERFRLAFEGSNDGVALVDLEGRFLKVNERMCEILGYTGEELEAMTVRDVTYRDDLHISASFMSRSQAGEIERSVFEKRYLHKRGHVIWGQVSASLIRAPGGEPLCYISHLQDVTERKRAEEALRAERDFNLTVLSTVGALVVVLDREGRIVRFNRACEQTTGYTSEEVKGTPFWDLLVLPEEIEPVKAVFAELRGGQFPNEHENYWVTRGGGRRLIEWSNTAILSPEGAVEYIIGTGIDITARRAAEQALAWESQTNAAIAELSAALIGQTSMEDIAFLVLEHAKRLTGSAHGYVGYLDSESGYLISPTMTRDIWSVCQVAEKDFVFREWRGARGWVLRHRQPLMSNRPAEDPRFSETPPGHVPVHSFLSVPAEIDGELVGQIALANSPRDYTEQDLNLVQRLAVLYAIAIQRRHAEENLQRSHNELERRVVERTAELARTNEELQASEAKHSTLVANSLTGISINLEGRIVFANDKFAEIFGYPREELIGIEVWRLVDPEDRGMVEEMRRKRLRGEEVPAEYESRGLTKGGETIWVARRNTVIDYEGKRAILGNLVDVTKRRNIEEALRRSERELRHLSSELLSAQESERGRIARELHDGIGQWLSAIKFRVEDALQQARRGGAEDGFQLLELVIPLIRKAIDEIRRISMDLRPATLDSLGILATISWLCRQFEETYHAIRVNKHFAIQEEEVPEGLKVVIYRILQEALNNVAKHSEARRVRVHLGKGQDTIELSVKDNGEGFELASVLNYQTEKPGFGLASMRERTELSGGSFRLESGKGKGTLIRASWPAE